MKQDPLFERLWDGSAAMEEWTAAVSHGAITQVDDNIITVHTTYFCGSVTAIRTPEGLVLIDTAKPDTARCVAISTDAALREMIPPGMLAVLAPVLALVAFSAYVVNEKLATYSHSSDLLVAAQVARSAQGLARELEAENQHLRERLQADWNSAKAFLASRSRQRAVFTCGRCGNVYCAGDMSVTIYGENGSAKCRACNPSCGKGGEVMTMAIEQKPWPRS